MALSTNETLNYYAQNAQEFIAGTVDVDMSRLYRHFLTHLPQDGSILDLGCGSGRDSKFFADLGYRVTAVDGSEELCRRAERLIGFPVRCLLFEELDYVNKFDGIWACASLLHVEKEKMPHILDLVARALKVGGTLYLSYKYGAGQRVDNGRFFSDYTETDIPLLFPEDSPLSCVQWWITQDERPERSHERWLNMICKKIEKS